jgi:cell division protein FtsQ
MEQKAGQRRSTSLLTCLVFCALLLTVRLIYIFISDAQRFPITTVKIAASYDHINRKQIEAVLSNYLTFSFFTLSVSRLQNEIMGLDWAKEVVIERVWPDTLKITIEEKVPAAIWNEELMTAEGNLFKVGTEQQTDLKLPKLSGPPNQQLDVLHNYQKLSKLLSTFGLHSAALQLRDNQAWVLTLSNGAQLQLGKRDLEERLTRFCKAYPLVFADKPDQLSSVDLRYARGMAVQWKQQME